MIQCAQRKWRTTDLLYTDAVDYELPGSYLATYTYQWRSFTVASLFKCDFSYSCACTVQQLRSCQPI